jgi:5-methyltetrahydropteroyltriglutamate--homocysteine methyltransferase
MTIPTEPIGSIPRPLAFIEAIKINGSLDPRVETPEEIRDRILEAARYIPVERLGTTDDCGFLLSADYRR